MSKLKTSDLPFVWGCALFSKNIDIIHADESLYSIFDADDKEKLKNILQSIFISHTADDSSLQKLDIFPSKDVFYSLNTLSVGNRKLYHLIVSDYTGFSAITENIAVLLDENHYYNHILNNLPDGVFIADENGLTSREGVYAGGDAVTGAATVILAMGAGKTAAAAIDEYIQNKK